MGGEFHGAICYVFPDQPWSQSAEIRIDVDGSKILGRDGQPLDGDGVLGGEIQADFTTLPLTRITGTDVFGYVFDSFNTNPDGSNIPVAGATVRVDAFPEANAVTDETGFFRLEDVPAPEFSVHIDGSTAVNAPTGTTYATVGKLFDSVPGQEVQLTMDGEVFDIFLPPLATGDVQALAPDQDTAVGLGDAGLAQLQDLFPDMDPSVWDAVQVTFPAGSAQDDQGNGATEAVIIPVAPDRLPAPLPPGLDPQLVISIQAGTDGSFSQTAGGATDFDVPAPVVFPNLEGLAPGEKSLIFSFNHDSGEWEVIGNGTVSEDGLSIVSDEDVGILSPGWHFVNPGVPVDGDINEPWEDSRDSFIAQTADALAELGQDVFLISAGFVPILGDAPTIVSAADSIADACRAGISGECIFTGFELTTLPMRLEPTASILKGINLAHFPNPVLCLNPPRSPTPNSKTATRDRARSLPQKPQGTIVPNR